MDIWRFDGGTGENKSMFAFLRGRSVKLFDANQLFFALKKEGEVFLYELLKKEKKFVQLVKYLIFERFNGFKVILSVIFFFKERGRYLKIIRILIKFISN